VLISPHSHRAPRPRPAPATRQFLIIIGMFALLYYLHDRPQMKRAKEQKQMTEALAKGDEGSPREECSAGYQARRSLHLHRNRAEHRGAAAEVGDPDAAPKGTIKSID